MAGDIKTKYPSSDADTAAFTCTLTSLAASATLVAGRETTAITNTTNLDEDLLVSGKIAIQSHATVGRVEVWAYAPISVTSGTPAYGKTTGTDAAVTFDSRSQAVAHGKLLWAFTSDASVTRSYFMPPTSLRQAFGELPTHVGLVVINGHGGALSATASDHALHYQRIQKQYT
jgi:hypothetical protein